MLKKHSTNVGLAQPGNDVERSLSIYRRGPGQSLRLQQQSATITTMNAVKNQTAAGSTKWKSEKGSTESPLIDKQKWIGKNKTKSAAFSSNLLDGVDISSLGGDGEGMLAKVVVHVEAARIDGDHEFHEAKVLGSGGGEKRRVTMAITRQRIRTEGQQLFGDGHRFVRLRRRIRRGETKHNSGTNRGAAILTQKKERRPTFRVRFIEVLLPQNLENLAQKKKLHRPKKKLGD
jgi:hypothetical protein